MEALWHGLSAIFPWLGHVGHFAAWTLSSSSARCFVFLSFVLFLFALLHFCLLGGGGGGYFFVYLFYFWLCFFPSFLFFSFFFVPLSFSPVHCSVLSLGLSLFLILSFVFRKKTIKWRRWSRLETICWLSGQNEKRLWRPDSVVSGLSP